MNTTLVTALFDIKRGEMGTSFNRPFSHYLENFRKLLRACKNIPMLVYVDPEHEEFVKTHRVGSAGTDIRFKKAEDFRTWFALYDKVNAIRTDPNWYNQVGWLSESTQAKLELYNPLVMSKMFMLNDASIFNPFDTENYLWIDGGITNTVHPGYFSHDRVIQKLEPLLKKFLFVCFPYETETEVHGFKIGSMNRYAGGQVKRVARGGFFGGSRKVLSHINGIYYNLLYNSLDEGLMGTEESIFTLITYLHPELVHLEMINGDGMLSTFFERAKSLPIPKKEPPKKCEVPIDAEYIQTEQEIKMNAEGSGTNLYVTCFNHPQQLQLLIDSIKEANPELLSDTNKYLIDNSIDETTAPAFNEIAKIYGFEIIRKGNLGVCGARQWAATHFHESGAKYIVWFEDDMLMERDVKLCKNGLNMHVDNWLEKCIKIVEQENLDFLKISFSEFFGDHHEQWAWYNIPTSIKNKHFPDGGHKMKWKESGCVDGLSYLVGDVYYSNWPSVMTRAGNYKVFLETVFASPFEQTIMSQAFQTMKKGRLRSGVLMASLINHNRIHHYDKSIRKEC